MTKNGECSVTLSCTVRISD